jgi:hypothetical protein
MGQERRRAPRIEVLGRLHGHVVSLNTPVTVREISMVGLSFSAPMEFPVGAIHDFRLTLGDGSAVMLKGRVVRVEADAGQPIRAYVMGVQFLDGEGQDDESGLGDVVERLK